MSRFFRQIGYFRHIFPPQTRATGAVSLIFVWASLLAQQPTSPVNPDAKSLLEKAIRNLPQAEYWTTTFRQQWQHAGLLAEAQGFLALGPARKVRLEIRIQLADSQAQLRLYSDGQTIWRQETFPNRSTRILRYSFQDLEQAIAQANLDEAHSARLREAILAEHGFQSLRWRLTELITRCQWGQPLATSLPDGCSAWLLEGSWNEKTLQQAFRGNLPEAPEVPRRCRVYLLRQDTWWGGDSLWPARIEWWGLPRNEKDEKILSCLEYAHPRRLDAHASEIHSPFTPQDLEQAEAADPAQIIADTLRRLR